MTRSRLRFAVLICWATTSASPVAPDALRATLNAARHDYAVQSADRFASSTIPPDALGSRFRVVFPLGNGDLASGVHGGFFSYTNGVLTLSVNIDTLDTEFIGGVQSINLADRVTIGAPRQGQNAFGARAAITRENHKVDALALIDAPAGMPTSYLGGPAYERQYWIQMMLDGPAAKRIAYDTSVVIDGTLAQLSTGAVGACTQRFDRATLNYPTEFVFQTCWAGAKVTRVAFTRSSTGELLKEWSTKESPVAQ